MKALRSKGFPTFLTFLTCFLARAHPRVHAYTHTRARAHVYMRVHMRNFRLGRLGRLGKAGTARL